MLQTALRQWKFMTGECEAAFQPGFDDAEWRSVSLPHDWAVEYPFSKSNSSGTAYLPGGTAWYRCYFELQPQPGKRYFLRFDGVYKNSKVWCGGSYLGHRPSGYAGFTYEITHAVRGGENMAAVRVEHEDLADSRWYTGSGIYRNVYLCETEAVYLDYEELVFHAEPNLNDASAVIRITAAALGLDDDASCPAVLEAVLNDPNGQECLRLQNDYQLTSENNVMMIEGRLPNALLWSPDCPNLYTLSLTLTTQIGGKTSVAKLSPLPVGIRAFRFDPDLGFFLNGVSMKIKGVCVHHDAGCLGAAVYPAVWQRRLEALKRCGCNALRMSHNPHMPELYSLCDELGFLVMDEAFDEWEGAKNKWWAGHNVYPPKHQGYAEVFPAWHEQDLANMIKRGRNHPSIILWSVGNEIDYPNDPYCHPLFQEMTGNNDANKPAVERQYNPDKPNAERLAVIAARLVRIVKKHDTTRPVLIASAFPELSSQINLFDPFDVIGYNYKEHLYEADHAKFPRLPLLGSENSHSMESWRAVRDNAYISSQFLWTGIDYLGESRGDWPVHGSPAGLLDIAGYDKLEWHRRKCLWSSEPYAYLSFRPAGSSRDEPSPDPSRLTRTWMGKPGAPVQIVCFTNLDYAELFLGGRSIEIRHRLSSAEYITWDVPFSHEALQVKAHSANGSASDTVLPAMPAVAIDVQIWQPAIPLKAYSFAYPPLLQIEICLLDCNGEVCRHESPVLRVQASGGRLLGIENGDLFDATDYSAVFRRTHCGKLLAYVLPQPGETVTVTVAPDENAGASMLQGVTVSYRDFQEVTNNDGHNLHTKPTQ